MTGLIPEPGADCSLCPRLVEYRSENQVRHPNWFNGAVQSFGSQDARLLIVGLAPGVTGANQTARPFTGDFAGDLLYGTLIKLGFATGVYKARPDDGLQLVDTLITNAVRCVPPQNKPTTEEIRQCNPFLADRIAALPRLRIIVALGKIAHDAILRATGQKLSSAKFAHGARHDLPGGLAIFDSYHCSRYNTNTRRLTPDMFEDVFAAVRDQLSSTQ